MKNKSRLTEPKKKKWVEGEIILRNSSNKKTFSGSIILP